RGRIAGRGAVERARTFFRGAGSDAVAADILARLAEEIVALVRAVVDRLELTNGRIEILLGGGLLEAGDPKLLEPIEAGLRELGGQMDARPVRAPPVLCSGPA